MRILSESVTKPRIDDRKYRVIELENGLEAFLIHDSTTDKASAALSVGIGSYYDPKDLPGLAHFLEHLLFMGTEKFPDEAEYNRYLGAHGGSSNAYTSSECTNYFFELSWPHLKGALDRFAQFFISPLFDESCTEREVLAVDSENKKNLSNDLWRLSQLDKSLSNPDHPYNKFSTGNVETLSEIPSARGQDIRDELLKFYRSHYSANLMRLVILGREDLDTLQDWALEYFSAVPNHDTQKSQWNAPPLAKQDLGLMIKARPVMDLQQLDIRFQVPNDLKFYKKNPSSYYAHLLGHESKGSLLYYFKEQALANGLSCGANGLDEEYGMFYVVVELTEKGVEQWQEVVECVFQYINMLKETGPKPWIFDEICRSSQAAFWYMQKQKPSTTCYKYAQIMQQNIPREDVLCYSLPRDYDPKVIEDYLRYLTPSNSRYMLTSSTFTDLNSKEQWYGTEYSVTSQLEFTKQLETIGTSDAFHIPLQNQFVPNDFEVLDTTTRVQRPTLVAHKPGFRVWYKKDDTFKVPKAQVNVKLSGSEFDKGVTQHMATELLVHMANDSLNDYTYYAEVAGLNYSLSTGSNGIEIHVTGFNEKLPGLLKVIAETLKSAKLDRERFQTIKERTVRNLKNARYEMPYKLLFTTTNVCWLADGMWPWNVTLAALEKLSLEDIVEHRTKVLEKLDLEFLVLGNFTVNDAKSLSSLVREAVNAEPLSLKPFKRSFLLPRPCHFAEIEDLADASEKNSAIDCRFQTCLVTDFKQRAVLDIMTQIVKNPVFDILRTKEQLGYVVSAHQRALRGSMFFHFIAQSERPTAYLEQRIEAILPVLRELISTLSAQDFQHNVEAVVASRLEKFHTLREEASSYWLSIMKGYYDFDAKRVIAEYAKTTTKEEVLEAFDKYLVTDAAKFVVHMQNSTSRNTPKGTVVENVEEFRSKLEAIPTPKPLRDLEFYEKDEPKL